MPSGPITAKWDGTAFVPFRRHDNECAARFTIGADYYLDPQEPVSSASRGHYFASLSEAWRNLPEDQAERFPTVERLRKWALVKAGYCDERTHVCGSKAEAQRLAAFVKPMDEFAVVIARECVVSVFTAKSQSARAMGKADFQKSKDAVLAIVSDMIGVDRGTLDENAGRAA